MPKITFIFTVELFNKFRPTLSITFSKYNPTLTKKRNREKSRINFKRPSENIKMIDITASWTLLGYAKLPETSNFHVTMVSTKAIFQGNPLGLLGHPGEGNSLAIRFGG